MSKRDYYEVLGVSKSADKAELKKAYRRLAMKNHPDRNPDDKEAEARFKEAKEAYEVLTDPQKRQAYDQYGHAGVDPNMGGGHGGFHGADFGDIFGDVFGDIFGGGRRGGGGRRQARGSDLQYNMEITLEEAVAGVTKTIRIPTMVNCETCDGSGAKAGTGTATCSTCHGQGAVRMTQGFSRCNRPVPIVAVLARSLKILVLTAMVRDAYRKPKPYRLKSLPVLIQVIVFVYLAKARRVVQVLQRVICMCRCTLKSIQFLFVMAPTFTVKFRSTLLRLHWAAKLKCPHWMAECH